MTVQILAGPLDVYYADVGTARPARSTSYAPNPSTPAPWVIIGDNLKGPDGITVDPSRSYTYEYVMNQTYPVESFISQAGLKFGLPLKDMRLDALRYAFNGNTVSVDAATTTNPAMEEIDLDIGHESIKVALLVVGRVPYDDGRPEARAVWWIPKANIEGPGSISYKLAEGSMYTLNFITLRHPTLGVGKLSKETAGPTT